MNFKCYWVLHVLSYYLYSVGKQLHHMAAHMMMLTICSSSK